MGGGCALFNGVARCTVHRVRARMEKGAAAKGWSGGAVKLRVRAVEGVLELSGRQWYGVKRQEGRVALHVGRLMKCQRGGVVDGVQREARALRVFPRWRLSPSSTAVDKRSPTRGGGVTYVVVSMVTHAVTIGDHLGDQRERAREGLSGGEREG
jgi:hypothetical protein